MEIFDRLGLWCGPVHDYASLSVDPHVVATGMITTMDHPQHGPIRTPSPPLRMSETPPTVRTAPPMLGQHTDEVLSTDLGYDAERIMAMRASGAI